MIRSANSEEKILSICRTHRPTKHDVAGTDEDDIEIVCTTYMTDSVYVLAYTVGLSCNSIECATHLSIRTNLEGSIDARRDAGPDRRREERRRSEALRAAAVDIF